MLAEEWPDPQTTSNELDCGDPSYSEVQDILQTFVLLTHDCVLLARSMLEATPGEDDVDRLERSRRQRLIRELEVALSDGLLHRWEAAAAPAEPGGRSGVPGEDADIMAPHLNSAR